MAEQKSDDSMHQVPIKNKKVIEMYRLSPTKHQIDAYSNDLIRIPGLEKTINIEEDDTDIVVMSHAHCNALEANNRVDLMIMIDQHQLGMGLPSDEGMGLSHNPQWLPIISIGSTTLNEGVYHIYTAVRNAPNTGKKSHCNGAGMLIQIFKPRCINQWIDIDLEDDKIYFNKDLEYQIEIRGKAWATAINVDSENLWFFYSDATNQENNGIHNVNYKNKREFDNKCYVSKIQCRLRNA